MRFTVVPMMCGAEVFDEKAGRPVNYYPTTTQAERAAARLNDTAAFGKVR